jgi:hypothetical protein
MGIRQIVAIAACCVCIGCDSTPSAGDSGPATVSAPVPASDPSPPPVASTPPKVDADRSPPSETITRGYQAPPTEPAEEGPVDPEESGGTANSTKRDDTY